jgi:hypothetical protein
MSMDAIAERFVRAFVAKDPAALRTVLAPDVNFRALTPDRCWEGTSADAVIRDVFGAWLEPSDDVEELESVEGGSIANTTRVVYRFRVKNPRGTFLVEQLAYLRGDDDHIRWLRIMCSGFLRVS